MTPQRFQLRRTKGWVKPAGAVLVSRPSRWGNPFPIAYPITREDSVRMYRELIVDREAWVRDLPGTAYESRHRFTDWHSGLPVPTVEEIRAALTGKDLVCWCSLADVCHADVLLELAAAPSASVSPPVAYLDVRASAPQEISGSLKIEGSPA